MNQEPKSKKPKLPRIRLYEKIRHNLLVPMSLAWRSDLSHLAKLVYGRLRAYEGKSGEARPKVATLAVQLAVSRDAAARALKELVEAGLIEVEHRCSRRLPSLYFFTDHPWLKETTPPKSVARRKRTSKQPLVSPAGQAPCLASETSPPSAPPKGESPRTPAGSPPPTDAGAEEVHGEEVPAGRGSTARPLHDASRRAAASAASPTKSPSEQPAQPQRNARHALTPSSAAPLSATAVSEHPVALAWRECTDGEQLPSEDIERLVAVWDGNVSLAVGWVRWALSPTQLRRLKSEGRTAPFKLRPGWKPTPAWLCTIAAPRMSYRGEFLHAHRARLLFQRHGWTGSDGLDVAEVVLPVVDAHSERTGREQRWSIETARKLSATLQRFGDELDLSAEKVSAALLEELPTSASPEMVARLFTTFVRLVIDHDVSVPEALAQAREAALASPRGSKRKPAGRAAGRARGRRKAGA